MHADGYFWFEMELMRISRRYWLSQMTISFWFSYLLVCCRAPFYRLIHCHCPTELPVSIAHQMTAKQNREKNSLDCELKKRAEKVFHAPPRFPICIHRRVQFKKKMKSRKKSENFFCWLGQNAIRNIKYFRSYPSFLFHFAQNKKRRKKK